MLSLCSQVISRRVLHSFRYKCIKTLQTNANQFENTFNSNNNFQRKLNRLEQSLRRIGRITFSDVDQCLHELSKPGRVRPTTTQSLLLIRSCGSLVSDESREKRRDFCKRMFETLSEATDLDISHYNQLLRVYVENEFDFDAIHFLERMQTSGIDPNRVTFILMIDRFCQTGNVSEAIKILEHMKSNDMPISESVFNSLIVGYGRAGDLQTAHQTLDMMKSSGIEPSADTYTHLLCAYASNAQNADSEQKMNEILEQLKPKEIELSERDIFKVVKSLAIANADSKLLNQMLARIEKSVNYNKECLEVITDLLFANRTDAAFRLYDTMEATESLLNKRSLGNPLIRAMIRANISPKIVIEFCEKLESESKNEFAIRNATEFALKYSNVSDCRTYLERLSRDQPLKVHYFYPLLVKCKNEKEILEILSQELMSFSGASYSQLIELFMDYIWPKNILDFQSFMDKCKAIGFSNTITYNSLIRFYITNDRIEEAVKLISSPNYSAVNVVKRDVIFALTDAFFKANENLNPIVSVLKVLPKGAQRLARTSETELTDHFGQFLLNLIRRNISENELNRVLQTFDRNGIKLSDVSVNAIRDRITLSDRNDEIISKLKSKSIDDNRGLSYHDIDDITKSRREMTTEELEGHLIELRSKGLNTRGVLRSLLMAYCRRTKFSDESKSDVLVTEAQKRVRQIVDELNRSEHVFTNAMHAMLMEFFVNCEDIESALEMKSKISNEFAIDCYKIVNFATLYVRNGQIDRAIDLIKVENSRKSDAYEGEESNPQLIRTRDMSIYRLLNSLLEAKVSPDLLKQVFELCVNYSSLTPTAIMAGPLVKYHILNEDYVEALDAFSHCAETYRITPWKNQLMKHFLENGDQMNLQKVIDYSNKIHGEMNTIMELAGICVEVGKLKQARKLLDTPGLRVKQMKMDSICEQLIRENKMDALEQLIRISTNVFDINRDRMLFHLIRGCVKQENPEKALNCWTVMQEENIQPSDETLIFLANYLTQNNITVPFAVPPEPTRSAVKPLEREVQKPQKLGDNKLNEFNVALKASNIEEALNIKKALESEGKSLLMSQNCSLIEVLLNSDRLDEAFDISKSLLESKLFPSPRIIRYLYLKLSLMGDYHRLEQLRPFLPEFLVQNNSYTNAVSFAYINSGKTDELIDDLLLQMKPFPLSGFLKALEVRPDCEERLLKIANDLIRESDFHLPLNMVWINCMKKERFEDAKRIYDSCPKLKDFLLFSSLLDSIRENKNIVLAKKLIQTVNDSNLTPKSIGVTYSALIDVHLELGHITEAEDVVMNEVVNNRNTRIDPNSETTVRLLGVEHLNRSTINRLTKEIREKEHRDPKFQINKSSVDTSSDSDLSGNSSSDEEVVDIKNK